MISTYQATHVTTAMREYLRYRYNHPVRSAFRNAQEYVLWGVNGAPLSMLVHWSEVVEEGDDEILV